MAEKPTLYVCHGDDEGPRIHPCRRVQEAMRDAGIEYEKVVAAHGNPIPFLRKGSREELRQATGDTKLPTLKLPDGTVIDALARRSRSGSRSSHDVDAARPIRVRVGGTGRGIPKTQKEERWANAPIRCASDTRSSARATWRRRSRTGPTTSSGKDRTRPTFRAAASTAARTRRSRCCRRPSVRGTASS